MKLIFQYSFFIITLLLNDAAIQFTQCNSYIDEDTIVIEAKASETGQPKSKRHALFLYPHPQYLYPQQTFATLPLDNGSRQCVTRTRTEGQCVTLRQCYPNVYLQNQEVATLLLQNLTLCASNAIPPFSNVLFTPQDARLVCCPKRVGRKIETESSSPEKRRLWNAIPFHLRKMVPPNVTPVPIQKYPWTVAIMQGDRHHCGGSLISKFTVLTAAHCLFSLDSIAVGNLRVLLGHHDISRNEQSHAISRKVVKSIFHIDFSMRTLHNDIGLLILDYSVPTVGNVNISPVKISSETPISGKAMIAGWGQMGWNLPPTPNLMETTIDIWSNGKCAAMYGRLAPGGITSTMLCGSGIGKDACRGDSGSPLMVSNNKGQTEQIGIVSWGIECGRYPSVHTRLANFMPWIQKNKLN